MAQPAKESIQSQLDPKKVTQFVEDAWKGEMGVLESLKKYISVPNQSPSYDEEIYKNGYQEQAMKVLTDWVERQDVKGLKMTVFEEKEKTPFIFIEIAASNKKMNSMDPVLLYGHFDKQPPLTDDWDVDKGLHPYTPVILDGKLYGRGGADDGYSIFGAILAIQAVQAQGKDHPRCVITIEASEESGSIHLDEWIEKVSDKMGSPSIVVCLDSGAADYNRMWLTTSLRGYLGVSVRVQLLKEGIHSGNSGKCRDSFHVVRSLLDRLDDPLTGEFKVPEFIADIPDSHKAYARKMAEQIGKMAWEDIPTVEGVRLQCGAGKSEESKEEYSIDQVVELLLNSTWRPQISVVGIDGIPDLKGGNVLRKYTTVKLSIRLPPSVAPPKAFEAIKAKLTEKPLPFNSSVTVENCGGGGGFVAPDLDEWLAEAISKASEMHFDGKASGSYGEGGSIPLMGQLKKNFPKAQFIVTGVLGPNSNAHGPNEFMDIQFTKNLIGSLSHVLNVVAQKQLQSV